VTVNRAREESGECKKLTSAYFAGAHIGEGVQIAKGDIRFWDRSKDKFGG